MPEDPYADPASQPDPTSDPTTGVTPPASPPGTTGGEGSPAQPSPTAAPSAPPPSEGVPDPSIPLDGEPTTDERGVPLQNVRGEFDRKFNELRQFVEDTLRPIASQAVPGTTEVGAPGTPSAPGGSPPNQLAPYTIEQLEYIASSQPEWRPQVEAEKHRRLVDEVDKRSLARTEAATRQMTYAQQHTEAMKTIASQYPFALASDRSRFNPNHPLVQRALGIYQADPAFKQNGYGWLIAFDAAYGQLARARDAAMRGKSIRDAKSSLPAPSAGQGGGGAPPPTPKVSTPQQAVQGLFAERDKHRPGTPEHNRLTTEIYRARGLIGTVPEGE